MVTHIVDGDVIFFTLARRRKLRRWNLHEPPAGLEPDQLVRMTHFASKVSFMAMF